MFSMKIPKNLSKATVRVALSAGVIALGVIGLLAFASLKSPPAEVAYVERPMRVEAIQAKPESVPVLITGYGEVTALDVVDIAPEVSGKIVTIHPRLEVGEVIHKGELLFKIDPRDYMAAVDEARAAVNQWANTIKRLKKQKTIEKTRLKSLKRNKQLAKQEYQRVQRLHKEKKVVSQSSMDSAERDYNTASDLSDQMEERIELYPIQIREAENNLSAAKARLTLAETRLGRCEVKAPFDGRIKAAAIEVGQYVTPGQKVTTLANDAVLEIHVPLDSRDARQWLVFNGSKANGTIAWFNSLDHVTCTIRWTEDREDHVWEGRLHRVVKFDQQTRTITVAIRIEAKQAFSKDPDKLPLVEGMFCSVEIPGKKLQNVYAVPRWAVTFDNTVYLSINNRLKTVPVKIVRTEGEKAYISDGLNPGDMVVTTRLVDPLENALLEIN
jgi:RND family efflux transporter MFP subunit